MKHFAKIENNIVTQVVETDEDLVNDWMLVDINVSCNVYWENGKATNKEPLHKNFPEVGWHYDTENDAFYPPKPIEFPSFILSKEIYRWIPPIPYPGSTDINSPDIYVWQEENQTWIKK